MKVHMFTFMSFYFGGGTVFVNRNTKKEAFKLFVDTWDAPNPVGELRRVMEDDLYEGGVILEVPSGFTPVNKDNLSGRFQFISPTNFIRLEEKVPRFRNGTGGIGKIRLLPTCQQIPDGWGNVTLDMGKGVPGSLGFGVTILT